MSAYWIARARMRDLDGQQAYAGIVNGIGQRFPYETLARAGRVHIMEGTTHFDRYFLHRFASVETAMAFYNSPEYQEAAAIRRAACDGCELVIMEGDDPLQA